MRRAAIVNPVRTPVGAFGGVLRPVPVETLGGIVATETLKRSDLDPKLVEDVVFAQSYANSETPCVGPWIALDAGFPIEVPGTADGSALRGRAPGVGDRRHGGADGRLRRRARGRRREHVERRILHDRHALGETAVSIIPEM
jgi:hypothetical protein